DGHVTGVQTCALPIWSRQFSGRLAGEGFNFGHWALNIPRSLGYFLPWIVFVPLLAGKSRPEESEQEVRSAHRFATANPSCGGPQDRKSTRLNSSHVAI